MEESGDFAYKEQVERLTRELEPLKLQVEIAEHEWLKGASGLNGIGG
jgi:hypothetical protein